jgi:hypothetical protein
VEQEIVTQMMMFVGRRMQATAAAARAALSREPCEDGIESGERMLAMPEVPWFDDELEGLGVASKSLSCKKSWSLQ